MIPWRPTRPFPLRSAGRPTQSSSPRPSRPSPDEGCLALRCGRSAFPWIRRIPKPILKGVASREGLVREARPRSLAKDLARSSHQAVKVAVTDVDGILRGKYLSKDKFLSALESGFGFCNVVFGWDSGDVCYDNSKYTGWHSGYPDAQVRIDPATQRQIPWDGGIPFFLGDFVDAQERPLDVCPRQLLKRVLARARAAGYVVRCGAEFEWFNFRETPQSLAEKGYVDPQPLTPGMFGYSVLRASLNQPYFAALLDQFRAFGVPLEGLHTETGPGVTEAAIAYTDALEAADRAVLFKT